MLKLPDGGLLNDTAGEIATGKHYALHARPELR